MINIKTFIVCISDESFSFFVDLNFMEYIGRGLRLSNQLRIYDGFVFYRKRSKKKNKWKSLFAKYIV